jgi:hypothetical protein
MAMFVSAKALAVIQFVALSFYRVEPAAILGQYRQGALTSCLMVCVTLGFEMRDEIEHFPGLGLGKRAYLVVDVFGRTHGPVYPSLRPCKRQRFASTKVTRE